MKITEELRSTIIQELETGNYSWGDIYNKYKVPVDQTYTLFRKFIRGSLSVPDSKYGEIYNQLSLQGNNLTANRFISLIVNRCDNKPNVHIKPNSDMSKLLGTGCIYFDVISKTDYSIDTLLREFKNCNLRQRLEDDGIRSTSCGYVIDKIRFLVLDNYRNNQSFEVPDPKLNYYKNGVYNTIQQSKFNTFKSLLNLYIKDKNLTEFAIIYGVGEPTVKWTKIQIERAIIDGYILS